MIFVSGAYICIMAGYCMLQILYHCFDRSECGMLKVNVALELA